MKSKPVRLASDLIDHINANKGKRTASQYLKDILFGQEGSLDDSIEDGLVGIRKRLDHIEQTLFPKKD